MSSNQSYQINPDPFELLRKEVSRNDNALTKFRKISDMPDEQPWSLIKKCVLSRDFHLQALGVLMCGALESERPAFFLSQTWLPKYLKAFKKMNGREFKAVRKPRSKKKNATGISGTSYDLCLATLQSGPSPFLKCIKKSSSKGSVVKRSGVYTINFDPYISNIPWWNQLLERIVSGFESPFMSGPMSNMNRREESLSQNRTEQEENMVKNKGLSLFDRAYTLYENFHNTGSIPNDFFKILDTGESEFKALDLTQQIALFQKFIQVSEEEVNF